MQRRSSLWSVDKAVQLSQLNASCLSFSLRHSSPVFCARRVFCALRVSCAQRTWAACEMPARRQALLRVSPDGLFLAPVPAWQQQPALLLPPACLFAFCLSPALPQAQSALPRRLRQRPWRRARVWAVAEEAVAAARKALGISTSRCASAACHRAAA